MTLTIRDRNKSFITVCCTGHSDAENKFREVLGEEVIVFKNDVYNLLAGIAGFVNNDLCEECLFELD